MLIKSIHRFHKKTEEKYRQEEEKNMEPWKKKVMELHEKSDFVFYYDDYEVETDKISVFSIRGEVVKGTRKKGDLVY